MVVFNPSRLIMSAPGKKGRMAQLPCIRSEEEFHGLIANGMKAGRAVQPLHPRFADVLHILKIAWRMTERIASPIRRLCLNNMKQGSSFPSEYVWETFAIFSSGCVSQIVLMIPK